MLGELSRWEPTYRGLRGLRSQPGSSFIVYFRCMIQKQGAPSMSQIERPLHELPRHKLEHSHCWPLQMDVLTLTYLEPQYKLKHQLQKRIIGSRNSKLFSDPFLLILQGIGSSLFLGEGVISNHTSTTVSTRETLKTASFGSQICSTMSAIPGKPENTLDPV